jgi:two-component system LytT family sensor kinase
MKYWPLARIKRHLLFWIGTGLFLFILPLVTADFSFCSWEPIWWGLLTTSVLALPTIVLYTYSLAYGLLPLLFRRQFVLFLLGVFTLYAIAWFQFDIFLYGLQYVLIYWFAYTPNYSVDTWLFSTKFPGGPFVQVMLISSLFASLKLLREWERKQVESQRFEREKLTQELALLKLRLNPDFLFDSLRTLHQLTSQQARQGPQVVLKLAHFLRYILYQSQADTVPIAWEVTTIEQFVFLQRAIHPTGLDVSLSVRGQMANQTIFPLLLFPIVEQAFRQLPDQRAAIKSGELSWVSIDIAIGETQLTLKVVHGYATAHPDDAVWVGDVRKRLHYHYGNAFDLTLHSEPGAYIVALRLPLAVTQLQETERQPLFKNSFIPSTDKPL